MKKYTILPLLSLVAVLSVLSCAGKKKGRGSIRSVLILGNSIVDHGQAPQLGWYGSWGMAASARDSDFVHRLITEIHHKDTSVKVKYMNAGNIEFEYNHYNFTRIDTLGTPDMLIMRFGENTNDSTVSNGFIRNLEEAVKRIDPEDKAVKVIVSGYWYRPVANRLLEQYAADHQYIYVRNDDLLSDSTNSAKGLFQNKDVAAHPSDKGMRLIKERIWEKIKDYF